MNNVKLTHVLVKCDSVVLRMGVILSNVYQQTEFRSGESPVDRLPFGNEQLEGEDTSKQSREKSIDGVTVAYKLDYFFSVRPDLKAT